MVLKGKENEVQVVVHCAAAIDLSSYYSAIAQAANVDGTKNLLHFCVENGTSSLGFMF